MAQVIVCANCGLEGPNRGRGLCARCYQYLWRTGRLPWPNQTTPEEVLGEPEAEAHQRRRERG